MSDPARIAARMYNRYPNYPHKLFMAWRGVTDLIVMTSLDTTGENDGPNDLGGYWYESLYETVEKNPGMADEPKLLLVAAHRRLKDKLKHLKTAKHAKVQDWHKKGRELSKAASRLTLSMAEDIEESSYDSNLPYLKHRDLNVERILEHGLTTSTEEHDYAY